MAKPITEEHKAEQKALKDICNRIRKQNKIDWLDLFNDRMDLGVSDDYEKNLDRGSAGPERVAKIRNWILTHEPDLAYALHPEFFPRSLRTKWQGLLEERGAYGHVHSKPFDAGLLHEISAQHPINTRIKLDQDFTIEIESPIAGSVIALNRHRSKWYPMVLRAEKTFDPVPVSQGSNGFPIRNGDLAQIIPMRQSHYPGEHGHCFLIGPHGLMNYYADRFIAHTEIPSHRLDEMAKRLMELKSTKIAVLLENVIFE